MKRPLDPIQGKNLAESKAALARHGVVIIRSVETDLEPAMMSAARNSISSSPEILDEMTDEQLDRFMDGLRKAAMKSAEDLQELYTRLLTQLGTEYIIDLVKELDGIEKLFTWDRVSRSVEPVNKRLTRKGFPPIRLSQAEDVSESLSAELEGKWPIAFERFRGLAVEAARQIGGEEPKKARPRSSGRKAPSKKAPSRQSVEKPKKSAAKRKR
ncbi:MAG: hypothetical protein JSV94_02445 [Methanobacteriota archaeon]|nr:MAG: hypothetical protein JSV94_02445 [Euryarchaeota archaeon]